VRLREFKARSLAWLIEIKRELLEKYPDRSDRINYIIDLLATKLESLRTYTLTDYIFTLYQASKEFRELERLIPGTQETDELLKGGE
jgi:hypothetical protein